MRPLAYAALAVLLASPLSCRKKQTAETGGVSDTIPRPLDAALESVFKQPVVLENKSGAAGAVGGAPVSNANAVAAALSSPRVSMRLPRW